jgi:hypothetical protein
MFQLTVNWWEILKKSWQVRLAALATALQGLVVIPHALAPWMESMSEIAPFLDGIIPQWLILVLLAASVVARVTKQKDLETVVPPADDDTLFV